MNTVRFADEHFASAQKRDGQNSTCSTTAKVSGWIHDVAQHSPNALCLASFAVGVGLGALVVQALCNASPPAGAESTLRNLGKRALDSLYDVLPTNLAQSVQSRFKNGFTG